MFLQFAEIEKRSFEANESPFLLSTAAGVSQKCLSLWAKKKHFDVSVLFLSVRLCGCHSTCHNWLSKTAPNQVTKSSGKQFSSCPVTMIV